MQAAVTAIVPSALPYYSELSVGVPTSFFLIILFKIYPAEVNVKASIMCQLKTRWQNMKLIGK